MTLVIIGTIFTFTATMMLWCYHVVNPLAAGNVDGIWGNRMGEPTNGNGWLRSKCYNYAWNQGRHDKGIDPFAIAIFGGTLVTGGVAVITILVLSAVLL